MKPSILDDDTLLLGCWVEEGKAAIVGAVRTVDGEIVPDVLERCAPTWHALVAALADAATIGANGWVILTNDQALLTALRAKKAPAPTESKRYWIAKCEYLEGKFGGDAAHWEVLQRLGMHGRWTVVHSDKLQKARELWQQG